MRHLVFVTLKLFQSDESQVSHR